MNPLQVAFGSAAADRPQSEKLQDVIKRLRGTVSINFEKARYKELLQKMRDQNAELAALRVQINAFEQIGRSPHFIVHHGVVPHDILSIRTASQELHEVLCHSWCCNEPAHGEHQAKLCLNAEVHGEVCIDMAVSYHEIPPDPNNREVQLSRPE